MKNQSASQLKTTKIKKLKEIEEKGGVVTQFYQTKLCKHFQNGVCLYGDKCSFSHSPEQLRERPNLTKTKMCALIEAGEKCSAGVDCPYAHAISELRATPMLYRTVLCSWWKKGQCEFGDNCRFAHGESQLRAGSPSTCPSKEEPVNTSTVTASTPSADSPSMEFPEPSGMYASIFSAALSAATTAAIHNGVSVLSPEQTAAIAAAASAAAMEAMRQQTDFVQPRTMSAPVVSAASLMKNELSKFKKGFSSSPALLAFFEENDREWVNTSSEEETSVTRPRADSEPSLKLTEKLMEEIRRLWLIEESNTVAAPGIGLSASHATLDAYLLE